MADSIPSRLFEQGKKRPNEDAYFVREGGVWRGTNFKTFADETKQAARAMMALGFEPGQCVSILGFNRPEWVIFDVGAMAAGGVPAGIYTTCSPSEVAYIISHCEAVVTLVEDEDQWKKIHSELANLPSLRHVVTMKGAKKIDHEMVLTWEEFLAKGDSIDEKELDDRVAALKPNDLATLIYTSGTTGPPKGVMLSHENLTWTANVAGQLTQLTSRDTSLSYLPLSHIAEQMFSIHGPITNASKVYYAESIDAVPDNIKEVQPTIFFGVPRIWEKFHAGVSNKLKQATGLKAKIASWAMSVGRDVHAQRAKGNVNAGGLKYALANKLIFSKVKPAIGLGNARVCVSGAAPIAKEVLEFFTQLDIVVLEVYGQSEDTGPTTFNQPNQYRFGTVGPRVPGVEVKIAEDDEICVRGPNVFLGYYKDEAATQATLIDGWLHSGDLGKFDSDGFLSITGRKKDIIITAGGKNVAPKNIEAALKNHEMINEAVVIGDRRKFLSALITIDPEAADRWCAEHGGDVNSLADDENLHKNIMSWVEKVNADLARVEQIKKFTVLERNFTIEDGELTPTLKVKRAKVNAHFADVIEAMYT